MVEEGQFEPTEQQVHQIQAALWGGEEAGREVRVRNKLDELGIVDEETRRIALLIVDAIPDLKVFKRTCDIDPCGFIGNFNNLVYACLIRAVTISRPGDFLKIFQSDDLEDIIDAAFPDTGELWHQALLADPPEFR